MAKKLTHTQKEILPKDVQTLIEAGFLTPDLKITEDLTYYLRHLTFVNNKSKVLKRAEEIVAENAKNVEEE